MKIYKISYAVVGKNDRAVFEDSSNYFLSDYEIVIRAAQHTKRDEIPPFGILKDPFRGQCNKTTVAQLIAWAEIEKVGFSVDDTNIRYIS
ncbi:hypothetical protein [Undibacterium terreum]|uniref:Uncharacterized protein n=1 Tax=Undibacterium terreum TaxID=1224302 RepID=A0A916UTW4_9BURK|nr:hypothetical protein [Undibacterium terreum]GGC87575.1 hypothetical protein GCM10011396_38550 [Undibacterium terreum]